MTDYVTFQTFAQESDALAMAETLQQQGIETDVRKQIPALEKVQLVQDFKDGYVIYVPEASYERARKLLYNDMELDVNDIQSDHPLLTFSTEELKAVVGAPKEWGADNYQVALALLRSRGQNTATNQQQRRTTASTFKEHAYNPSLIITGYVGALLPFAINWARMYSEGPILVNYRVFFIYFAGPMIAWSILSTKTTLPNGKRVSPYTKASILHALYILGANIISLVVNVIILLFTV